MPFWQTFSTIQCTVLFEHQCKSNKGEIMHSPHSTLHCRHMWNCPFCDLTTKGLSSIVEEWVAVVGGPLPFMLVEQTTCKLCYLANSWSGHKPPFQNSNYCTGVNIYMYDFCYFNPQLKFCLVWENMLSLSSIWQYATCPKLPLSFLLIAAALIISFWCGDGTFFQAVG